MDNPQHYLDLLVAWLTPHAVGARALVAPFLFLMIAHRPKHKSRAVMAGRVLELAACILWLGGIVNGLAGLAILGDYVLGGGVIVVQVADYISRWPLIAAEKACAQPSPEARIWRAWWSGRPPATDP